MEMEDVANMEKGLPLREKHVILVGFMGVGKTTVGQKVADALSREFIDTDREIEKRFQKSVAEIFQEFGEKRFREAEKETITDICRGSRGKVIALGGGAYLNEEIRRVCQEYGIVFHLDLSWEPWCERMELLREGRPLLQEKALHEIEELYRQRRTFYEMGSVNVPIDGLTPEEVVERVVGHLRQIWDNGEK